MKNRLFLIAILWATISQAQKNIIEEINPLLQPNTINQAEKKVDEYLQKDSLNVDALMMKGNVILSKFKFSTPILPSTGLNEESIFESSTESIPEDKITLDEATAKAITRYYLKAVSIDKNREDIHLGICYTYSIALMADELFKYLPILKKRAKPTPNLPFVMSDYANNLIVRNHFEEGMKIYLKIAELFPESGGIMNDISSQYKIHGDLTKAKYYIEKAMARTENDVMTYTNAFATYTDMEDYDKAINALKTKSTLNKNKDYLLFQALVEFKQGGNFKKTLSEFINSASPDTEGIKLAQRMLVSTFSMDAYDSLTRIDMTDAHKLLLLQYFATKFPNEFNPNFAYGDLLNFHQLYTRAIEVFKDMPKYKLSKEKVEGIRFGLAWALYKTKKIEEANVIWDEFLTSENIYYKSAAAYFLGKYYISKNEKERAKVYLKLVADRAAETKYANFCSNLLKR